MRVSAHGLSIEVPGRWEARISRHGQSPPILHVASFTLHPGDGAFGASATARMRADDAFAALIEYQADHRLRPGVGLFEASAWDPRLRRAQFTPDQLQVTRAGQLGSQRFFTHAGRPFCLYAVVAPVRRRPEQLVRELSAVLGTLRFES